MISLFVMLHNRVENGEPDGAAKAQAVDTKPDTADSQPNSAFAALEGVWSYEKIISAGQTVPKEKFPYEIHFKSPNQLIRKGITVGQVTGKDGTDT